MGGSLRRLQKRLAEVEGFTTVLSGGASCSKLFLPLPNSGLPGHEFLS